jgi:GTPase SAR1 family protein
VPTSIENSNMTQHLKFKTPFTAIIAGPTSSGKTLLTRKILRHYQTVLYPTPQYKPLKVLWAYGQWQPLYNVALPNVQVTYYDGLPPSEELESHHLIVIDDLMSEAENSKDLLKLFTRGSHHNNQNVIFITQNLFHKGQRDMSLNSHYIILMKNPRDSSQIQPLARQMDPLNWRYIVDAYKQATEQSHGYLLFDLRQDTPQSLRFRTRITPEESGSGKLEPIVFKPNV